jgi:hypothetical protein
MLQRARCNRIIALLPERNAQSDGSELSDVEEEFFQSPHSFSSSPPTLDSSLERMNLLDSDDEENPSSITQAASHSIPGDEPVSSLNLDVPLSPVINAVFPSTNEIDYNSIPSISSIPLLPSPAVSSPITPLTSRGQIFTRSIKRGRNMQPRLPVKRAKRLQLSFHWKKTRFAYSASIEPVLFSDPPLEEISPRRYFAMFFSDEIVSEIVNQSNMYSVEKTGRSANITKLDIEHFVAIHILMGVVRMPCYLDYWSSRLRYPPIADVMPLKKYQLIRRFIHFANNNEESTDRYQKVRPVIESIRQNCLLAAEEEDRYSIDEMTLPYKGKKAGNRRQYNAKKPKKWGFKAFVRSGVSGFVYDFLLYGGDDTFRNINFSSEEETLGFGGKVVVALCQSIKKRPCFVYFDNYYTSLELVVYLRNELGIFSLGTVKANRLRGCQDKLDTDKVLKRKGRGSFSQIVCNRNKVSVVKWLDIKPVTLACSFADAYPINKVNRYSKELKSRTNVDCPQVVKFYNMHMGGVDLADMLVALYRTQIKSRRWYMGIFAQMIDISVNNGWILYRRYCAQKKIKKTMSLKEFRCQIFLSLTSKSMEQHDISCSSQKIKKPVVPRPVDDTRYDGADHLPIFEEKGRCRLCKTGQTSICCSKCKTRLCMTKARNCFFEFHVKN